MREEDNAYEGTSLILERPADLDHLDPRLAGFVPQRVKDLFRGYPGSFQDLAAKSHIPAFERWLKRIASAGQCELGIHRPGPRVEATAPAVEIYLHVGDASSPILLQGGMLRVPKRCPPQLAEVFRSVGAIREQYGASGGLIRPADQRPLSSLHAELVRNQRGENAVGLSTRDTQAFLESFVINLVGSGIITDGQARDAFGAKYEQRREEAALEAEHTPLPPSAQRYFAFYENGCGSYVAANDEGETWHFPMAGGDSVPGPPLATWLESFFDTLGT